MGKLLVGSLECRMEKQLILMRTNVKLMKFQLVYPTTRHVVKCVVYLFNDALAYRTER